jgi:hypothetical protein
MWEPSGRANLRRNGAVIKAPWLLNGGHGASLRPSLSPPGSPAYAPEWARADRVKCDGVALSLRGRRAGGGVGGGGVSLSPFCRTWDGWCGLAVKLQAFACGGRPVRRG